MAAVVAPTRASSGASNTPKQLKRESTMELPNLTPLHNLVKAALPEVHVLVSRCSSEASAPCMRAELRLACMYDEFRLQHGECLQKYSVAELSTGIAAVHCNVCECCSAP